MANVNKQTGEIDEPVGKLNELIVHEGRRPDGSYYYHLDFSNCPSMAEQHSARETDLNYLIERYKPDELAAYMAARAQYKREIIGHDFSIEPNYQEARNITYQLKSAYDNLSDDIKNHFKSHVDFLKFIDNPANAEKMVKLGLLTKKEIQNLTEPQLNNDSNDEKTSSVTEESPPKKESKK